MRKPKQTAPGPGESAVSELSLQKPSGSRGRVWIMALSRSDGRTFDSMRPVRFTRGWLDHAEGSCLVEFGRTRVLVAASVSEGVPRWRKGTGLGWVTSEYEMLPRATNTRNDRESRRGKVGGRTHEISRLIGRSLRAIIDYKALGENTIIIDADVLQADGGTRTASITGAYLALHDAVDWLRQRNLLAGEPLTSSVSAISVGIVHGQPMLDLAYDEDSHADVDMNIVCDGSGKFIEVQGTAEGDPYDRDQLNTLLDLGLAGCTQLRDLQVQALAREAK
jgi:ribonuclease PH